MGVVVNFGKSPGQRQGIIDHAAPFFIGHVFPRTADTHLDDRRRQRSYDDRHQQADDTAVVVIIAAAKDSRPLGNIGNPGNDAGKGRHDGADENIPVQHMGHFMC